MEKDQIVRFGIIGAGRIADKFCDAVSRVDGAVVAAVSSKSVSRARDSAARNGVDRFYDNYERMLLEEKPDAVYIATIHGLHYENILLCLRHRIPVLCEKPMVLTEAEAVAVFDAAREAGVFVMEAMWSRFLPSFQKAAEWIAAGRIGTVCAATYHMGFQAEDDSRVLDPKIAGGALYDIGVYALEGLTGLINQPLVEAAAMIQQSARGVDLTDSISLRFESCVASILCTVAQRLPNQAEILGQRGRILLPAAHNGQEAFLYPTDGEPERFEAPFENGFTFQIVHTMDCIRRGLTESPIMPASATIQCARIFDTILGTGGPRE